MSLNQKIPTQELQEGQAVSGFLLKRIEPIGELHATAYIFEHRKTGARLLHLFNDDAENLFTVAFRTPVSDDTGVPHILEHSVLCGSKKFPVKDPFQEMLKGSLQTFLNALTYRDKTVYPVASQVEKDFFNLVNVYCDAVFHPIISENTFYQEGWHFDLEDPSRPAGIKGIVYNEMKGVFSDFASHVARKTVAALMPETTYAFESGGDPERITDLTYEGFISFYKRFYHPSNAYFFLYGNIPSPKTLQFLDELYLAGFPAAEPNSAVAPQKLWDAPRSLVVEAPAPREDDGTATVLVAWIFGNSTDPLSVLCGSVLGHYLLGTESSPLRRALIDSGLGQDLDETSGFDVEAIQSIFIAGLRKTRPEHAEKIVQIVSATLRNQIENGLDDDLLEGALRQVEFHLREVNNGHMPHHLKLADRCFNSWLYGGDPLAHLAFEKTLTALKEYKKTGDDYFREQLRKNLLDNPHRLLATITASTEKGNELQSQTERQAALLSASFSAGDRERYRRLTNELLKQQGAPASPEALATLPRLAKSDLPLTGQEVPCETGKAGTIPVYMHPIFSSDIVYLDLGFDLRGVPPELVPWLPLYLELLRRCGAGTFSYEAMATRIALSTGGIGTSSFCRTMIGSGNELFFHAFVHGKALRSRFGDMLGIISDILSGPDLSNRKQIQDIILEERNNLNASVIGSGHQVALLLSSAPICHSRRVEEAVGGISQLRFLDHLAGNDGADRAIPFLRQLHALIVNKENCVVSMTSDDPASLQTELGVFLDRLPSRVKTPEVLWPSVRRSAAIRGVEISSAVNFASRTWLLEPFEPEAYGSYFLLSRHLSTGYLWDKVRVEGGAYGGMAIMSNWHPVFSCTSYRDPNLATTLRHFDQGLHSMAAKIDPAALEQSIIAAIGRIDQPKSPHNRGFGETLDRLSGFSPEARRKFRDAVLGISPKDLTEAAEKVLQASDSSIAVLGSSSAFDGASAEGLKIEREPLL